MTVKQATNFGSGTGSGGGVPSGPAGGDLTGTYPDPTIADDAVTNAKLAEMAANTIKGNDTAGSENPTDLTVAEVITMLGLMTLTPQGRLTLSSTLPVLTGDAVAQTTVYYLPYVGSLIPLYNDDSFTYRSVGDSGLSLALDSDSGHAGYQQSGKNFDLFVYDDGGTLRLGSGPAWTSDTARDEAIEQINGVWVNSSSITLRFGSAAGNTTVVAANQATYVGTMRATADGQTGMAFKPVALTGGTNNVLGLYNAYNRIRIQAQCLNSTTSWTYNSATPRAPNASASMRINFIDGLQQSNVVSRYRQIITGAATNVGHYMSSNLDVTNLHGGITGNNSLTSGTVTVANETCILPQLGFHFVSAIESSNNAGTGTFLGAGTNPNLIGGGLYLEMDM